MGGRVSVLALRGVKQEARRAVKSSSPKHWAEDTGREKELRYQQSEFMFTEGSLGTRCFIAPCGKY